MRYNRRNLLRLTGAAAVGAAAGCIGGEKTNEDGNDETNPDENDEGDNVEETDTSDEGETESEEDEGGGGSPELAAAASLNVLRTRLHDAVALGRAGETEAATEEASGLFAYFEEAGGEPHSVNEYEDGIPKETEYWASGGFSSEQEAREGWEEGEGAVQKGEYYERTFETTGTHEYFCIPHEAAGMVGEVVVEE